MTSRPSFVELDRDIEVLEFLVSLEDEEGVVFALDGSRGSASSPASGDWDIPGALLDVEKFGLLYRDQAPVLRKFLRIHVHLNGAEAEDIAQEAFIVLMRHLEGDVFIDSVSSYLTGIAKKLAMRYVRRRDREILAAEAGTGYPPVPVHTEDTANAAFERKMVLRLIRNLPKAQRKTMSLVYDGYGPSEISEMLGVSVQTVRSNLRHARKMLKEQMRTWDRTEQD